MSDLINKIKSKATSSNNEGSNSEEQSFSIQPHPAKTNDPADLQSGGFNPSTGTGLNNNEQMGPFHARDPHIPTDPQVKEALSKQEVKSRDELRARQEDLNRK